MKITVQLITKILFFGKTKVFYFPYVTEALPIDHRQVKVLKVSDT